MTSWVTRLRIAPFQYLLPSNRTISPEKFPERVGANAKDSPIPLPSLTGIRLMAALFVLIAHSSHVISPITAPRYQTLAHHLVFAGMTLFFVLSGFIITYNYLELFRVRTLRDGMYRFLTARFARIFPLYLFMLIVVLASMSLKGHFTDQQYWLPLYLTQTHFVTMFVVDNGIPVHAYFMTAWSIGTEWFFYLGFPVVAIGLQRVRTPRMAAISCFACWLVGIAVLFLLSRDTSFFFNSIYLQHKGAPLTPQVENFITTYASYVHPAFRMFEFLLGCLAARFFLLVRHLPVTRREAIFAHSAFIAMAIFTIWIEKLMGDRDPYRSTGPGTPNSMLSFIVFLRMNLLHAPFIAFLLIYVVRYVSPLSWFLNLKPIVAGGEASYSIYLLHPFLLGIFAYRSVPGGDIANPTNAALETLFRCLSIFFFIAILSRGLYLQIEIPGKDLVRRIAKRLDSPRMPIPFPLLFIAIMYAMPFVGIATAMVLFYRYP
jgi:peptidoglycan/LPS O-acetylase OafA/YrhL